VIFLSRSPAYRRAAHGWAKAERNGARLHHATYEALREAYTALPSQLHCAARVKVTEALKSVDERLKQGRKARPFCLSAPISGLRSGLLLCRPLQGCHKRRQMLLFHSAYS
jgi:hypothetical protein